MSYTCIHLLVHYHIGTSLFSRKKGIQKQNPDQVPNSWPIPDHFWHFGLDPDQVRNSGPFWSLCFYCCSFGMESSTTCWWYQDELYAYISSCSNVIQPFVSGQPAARISRAIDQKYHESAPSKGFGGMHLHRGSLARLSWPTLPWLHSSTLSLSTHTFYV